MQKPDLDGAWEERGVIGTRVEIEGGKLVILWRSAPVLTTAFSVKEREGGVELALKKKGLRYQGAASDYAEVTRLVFREGTLTLTEDFPITGESVTILTRTDRTRYGNYVPSPEDATLVAGEWEDEKGYYRLSFSGKQATVNGNRHAFVILRPMGNGPLFVADENPAVEGWDGMDRLEIRGDTLVSRIFVCDASPVPLEFHRVH